MSTHALLCVTGATGSAAFECLIDGYPRNLKLNILRSLKDEAPGHVSQARGNHFFQYYSFRRQLDRRQRFGAMSHGRRGCLLVHWHQRE